MPGGFISSALLRAIESKGKKLWGRQKRNQQNKEILDTKAGQEQTAIHD